MKYRKLIAKRVWVVGIATHARVLARVRGTIAGLSICTPMNVRGAMDRANVQIAVEKGVFYRSG